VGTVSYHGETGEDTRRNPRMEPGSGKRRSLWTASSRKTGPKWVWKRLVEFSTMSLGSTKASPSRPTALGLLKRYPSAQAMAAAGIQALTTTLHELAPGHFGLKTARRLLQLAQESVSSGVATAARARSLAVLCDQLEHTQTNLTQ
jgi:hypothetical protein